jgi:hypothetical protein
MIDLGSEAKDRITKFSGVIIGYCKYLNGCERYLIQPKKLRNEKMVEAEWIDSQQVEVTKAVKKKTVKKVGGPGHLCPKK